jgi:uncharacterized damage-inducible protein DinB
MLSFKSHLTVMAHYNAVMNDRLIATVRPLGDAELAAPRGAFFGSILGTMNHLVVGDLMWLNRMRPYPFGQALAALDGLPKPSRVDEILCPGLAAYEPMRRQLDALLGDFVAGLGEEDLAAPFAYRNRNNEPFTKTLGLVLSHVFNHQTHHRGQITTLLSQMGLDIGVTDLAPMVPDV